MSTRRSEPGAVPGLRSILPPEQSLASLAREVHRSFARLLAHRLTAFEVTAPMWSYLWTLWQEDGISQRELSRRIKLEGPTVGTALGIMEARGLVRRERNEKDRREWRVYLTERGRALRAELLEIGGTLNDDAVADLSQADTLHLIRTLVTVRRTLEAMIEQLPTVAP